MAASARREAIVDTVMPLPFLSAAVRAGDFIFVSGVAGYQPGTDATAGGAEWRPATLVTGGIEAETKQALANLKRVVELAGATLEDVVRVNAFLRDVDRDFWAYNEVYKTVFTDAPPARTTVQGQIYGGALVEIDCMVLAPSSQA